MNIYTRKPVFNGINIVPMLDILTILLIFFIVQTEFKRQVSVLDITIPQTENISGSKGDRNQVLLEIAADGTLALNGKLITTNELPQAAKELMEQNPQASIQVCAAEGATMGRFIQTLDILQAAGINAEQAPVRITPQQ